MNKSNLTSALDYQQSIAQTQQTVVFQERNQLQKADAGKPRMELIPTSVYQSLGKVLTFGANKYGANNWQTVDVERYVGALLRHLCAFLEDPCGNDADSGLAHTEHLLTNAAFINHIMQERIKNKQLCEQSIASCTSTSKHVG